MEKNNLKVVTCLNCGHKQDVKEIYKDDLGDHIICENCGCSFNIADMCEDRKDS